MGKQWCGSNPICDFCQCVPDEFFVDGKTKMGPWAIMCKKCFKVYGTKLGLGYGQKYDAKTFIRIDEK